MHPMKRFIWATSTNTAGKLIYMGYILQRMARVEM
jgi:hypothetical protein